MRCAILGNTSGFARHFGRRLVGSDFLLVVLLSFGMSVLAEESHIRTTKKWDLALPSTQFNNVDLQINGMIPAWKEISDRLLLRTVLFVTSHSDTGEDLKIDVPFTLKAQQCKGKDVLDAFAETFSLRWVPEPRSGVIWFIPEEMALEECLPGRLKINNDQMGLSMLDGVIWPILDALTEQFSATQGRVYTTQRMWSQGFKATFGYSMDLPAGVYTLREIVSLCCSGRPAQTFACEELVLEGREVAVVNIHPVNLYAPEDCFSSPQQGAVAFWREMIGPVTTRYPGISDMRTALTSSDETIRWAAQCYYETHNGFEGERLKQGRGLSIREQVQIELSMVEVHSPNLATSWDTTWLRETLTPDVVAALPKGLALRAAVEIFARTGSEEQLSAFCRNNGALYQPDAETQRRIRHLVRSAETEHRERQLRGGGRYPGENSDKLHTLLADKTGKKDDPVRQMLERIAKPQGNEPNEAFFEILP